MEFHRFCSFMLSFCAAGLLLLTSTGWGAAAQAPEEQCPTGNFTASDCTNNACYAAEPNGCGSRSLRLISAEIVPDRWPAGVDFSEACNRHDMCYFTPGARKEDCDNGFHQALLAECERALRCVDVPVIGQQCFTDARSNPLFSACRAVADAYYKGVSAVAGGPFDNDQADAQAHAEECMARAAGGG